MRAPAPPTLWLRCGRCDANLATVTMQISPRPAGAMPLPGDDLVITPRRETGRWTARTRRSDPDEFTNLFSCRKCRADFKVSHERLARWWGDFLAAGHTRDVVRLGQDW